MPSRASAQPLHCRSGWSQTIWKFLNENRFCACRPCVLALLPCAPLAAQDDTDAPAEPRPEIIVTGRGLDPALSTGIYATTTLERETIIASPSGRIEDVLRNVAGFQQFRRSDSRAANPSAQGVTLRALGGNATSRAPGAA